MLTLFRSTAMAEAWSYLFLLFIAVPLKYGADLPVVVKVAGSAHGVLFVLYCLLLVYCAWTYRWSAKVCFLGLVAAFLPFGPFLFDRHYLPTDSQNPS